MALVAVPNLDMLDCWNARAQPVEDFAFQLHSLPEQVLLQGLFHKGWVHGYQLAQIRILATFQTC